MCICTHTHMYVCFEGEKKAQKFSPPAADETPDPIIYQVQSISNTFTHSTSSGTKHLGFRGGAAGAMDVCVCTCNKNVGTWQDLDGAREDARGQEDWRALQCHPLPSEHDEMQC